MSRYKQLLLVALFLIIPFCVIIFIRTPSTSIIETLLGIDPRDPDIAKLEDYLNTLTWTKPYEKDVFDCSDMSYSLESLLENEGWHTIIVSNTTHMWLLVEIRKGYMPVEATGLFVVWWDNPNFNSYFIYDNSWEEET